ncbi:MAG: hypothetical protein Fur0046_35850 [Cyanobacteria bacterium J069]|nr:MAG: DUF4350 domain-containing protein [Cyanobacteria bacterium J069]
MKLANRRAWLIVSLVLAALVLLSAIAAPSSTRLRTGSTYGRAPDGYGAWFAFMAAQGTPVQRWQRPFQDLLEPSAPDLPEVTPISTQPQNADPAQAGSPSERRPPEPMTLVGISPFIEQLLPPEEAWLRRGNVLVLVGVRSPVTGAPFRSVLPTPHGEVVVETTRRQPISETVRQQLGDRFGAVAWERSVGRGKIIGVAAPHLAANAYQDQPGNFQFLAELVMGPGHPVWVDEYIHGYRDPAETAAGRSPQSVWTYLSRTPVALIALQSLVLLGLAVWAANRRLGQPLRDQPPQVNNSEAYIQALGTVLRKAECSDFVVETVSKAEQLNLQRSLGLGTTPLDLPTLTRAWEQQTGRPAAQLRSILNPGRKKRMGDRDLLMWLRQLRDLRE